MALVWDEDKRAANLRKHGLDFADARLVYDNPDKLTFSSPRNAEDRLADLAMVEIAGRVLTLIYTERGKDVRVISFRIASRKERRIYEREKERD
jgi:uncharacterized DUF497 family protein